MRQETMSGINYAGIKNIRSRTHTCLVSIVLKLTLVKFGFSCYSGYSPLFTRKDVLYRMLNIAMRILRSMRGYNMGKISMSKLYHYCSMSADDMARAYGADANKNIFIDNGARVLGVAHRDTVQPFNGMYRKDNKIFTSTLDDRLGVHTLLHYLPSRGIKMDVLICDDEEIGRSTAQYWKPPAGKEYNWIVEFDRTGEDVVCYQYDSVRMRKRLKESGFKVGYGSFSDICYLEDLGVKGFNVGVGYYNYHSKDAYFKIDEYLRQMDRFIKFYKKWHNVKLNHEVTPDTYGSNYNAFGYYLPSGNSKRKSSSYNYGKWHDYYDDSYWSYRGSESANGTKPKVSVTQEEIDDTTDRYNQYWATIAQRAIEQHAARYYDEEEQYSSAGLQEAAERARQDAANQSFLEAKYGIKMQDMICDQCNSAARDSDDMIAMRFYGMCLSCMTDHYNEPEIMLDLAYESEDRDGL